MLAWGAAPIYAIAPPAGEAKEASLLQPAVSPPITLTSTDKVFCIGANKAGTSTLRDLFYELPGNWNPCHDQCEGASWSEATWTGVVAQSIFMKHRVFMDNGDNSNWKWLDHAYYHSRFVFNSRKMYDWLLSRFDQIRDVRVAQGCRAQGTEDDCPTASWPDNSDHLMEGWILYEAQHQAEMHQYFMHDAHRRNRFVMIDVTDGTSEDTLHRLQWVMRTDLNSYLAPDDGLMTLSRSLPAGAETADANADSVKQIPWSWSNSHDPYSMGVIRTMLTRLGCGEDMFADRVYYRCANMVYRKWFPGNGDLYPANENFDAMDSKKVEQVQQFFAEHNAVFRKAAAMLSAASMAQEERERAFSASLGMNTTTVKP